jgi:hypothetical protein
MEQLSKTLLSSVSLSVEQYCKLVGSKYNIPVDELLQLWNSGVSQDVMVSQSESKPKPKAKKSSSNDDKNVQTCCYVMKKGKNEGAKCSSKVSDENSTYCKKHETQGDKPTAEKKTKAPKKEKAEEKEAPVVAKATKGKVVMAITRNKHGNYEQKDSGLVFDPSTKQAYGKQQENGTIAELTLDDIEYCKKKNYLYRLPESLKKEDDDEDVEEDVKPEDEDEDVEDEDVEEEDDE